jgi:hypothetical protein
LPSRADSMLWTKRKGSSHVLFSSFSYVCWQCFLIEVYGIFWYLSFFFFLLES